MQGLFTVYLCGSSKQGGGTHFLNPQIFTKYCTTLSQNSPKSHLCKRCFTNLNWDILFHNSVHYAKTPAMKVRNIRNGITSRDESNSITGTVA
jgi:hypothetical protein